MLISSKMVKEYETTVILGARSNLQIVFAVLVRLTLALTDGVKVTGLAVSYRDGWLTWQFCTRAPDKREYRTNSMYWDR